MAQKRILFVPAHHRNLDVLRLYAQGLSPGYETFFLRNRFFGDHLDIGSEKKMPPGVRLTTPEFLLAPPPSSHDIARFYYMWKLNTAFEKYLREFAPDLIVIGVECVGIGRWISQVAKKLGIPTLATQEGGGWLFGPLEFPMKIRIKRALNQWLASSIYPPARQMGFDDYFKSTLYSALWGEYDRNHAISRGLNPSNVFVVGDPRIPNLTGSVLRKVSEPFQILFVDFSASVLPRGTFDEQTFNRFKVHFLDLTKKRKFKVRYKIHPFTPVVEKQEIIRMLRAYDNVELLIDGTAEQYLDGVHICVCFPSTTIYRILAEGIPLIYITLEAKGFGEILWKPTAEFGAGLQVKEDHQLEGALQNGIEDVWRRQFFERSRKAAEYLVGPLDGRAQERFAAVVEKVLASRSN